MILIRLNLISTIRIALFLFVAILLHTNLLAQKKVPCLFKMQETRTLKNIHKYLQTDTVIETSGAYIHVYFSSKKNKPYLLLLHGMGVDAKTNWYRQIKTLSKEFNLIMPDLIYFGESKSKITNYSPEFQVQQINEALQLLKINSRINVMGFSYGALCAALYNQLFSAEVNKLILIDGPIKYYSTHLADSLANAVGAISMANILVPQNLSEFKSMQKAVLSKKLPMGKRLKRKFMAYYFTPTKTIRQSQLNYLGAQQTTYQTYMYNLDKTPTLLIWGGKDGVVPLKVGQDLHANFPSTTKLIIHKKAKHDAHFRYSKKVNREVIQFLNN